MPPLSFRYALGARAWYARSPLDAPRVILRRRVTESAARVRLTYYLTAVTDANVVL